MIRAAVLWLVLSGAAMAQGFPTLHDVSGVSAGDVLNVRDAPSVSGTIIGALAPDATDIEVVERQGNWGRLNSGEGSGWASLTYMAQQPGAGTPPVPRRCFGTEPFWTLTLGEAASRLDRLGEAEIPYGPPTILPASGRLDRAGLLLDGAGTLDAVYAAGICSDGMSDRLFGIGIDLILRLEGQGPVVLSGCCTLAGN
ncbi:SH3 domain-containing protein [Thetidibacter halocola]|uniref:SH3 domain-containing protein n=1 Tax=Thetidibacter halocola TaxID=2827239 RepID=A0A8J7WG98_9RHOB|nr:SH3 domain-containing protein [Thetidibacter halocola]MBS0125879.1 SH3 domain-containing protein [Thetidibacter halocola]